MDLSKHDHSQMNDEWLKKPPAKLFLEMWKQLLHDVKELQDRLNHNPDSGSRPPTSQPPWAKTGGSEEQSGAADERRTADVAGETAESSAEEQEQAPPADGHRPGMGLGSGPASSRAVQVMVAVRNGRSPRGASTASRSAPLVRQRCRRMRCRRLTRPWTKWTWYRRSRA